MVATMPSKEAVRFPIGARLAATGSPVEFVEELPEPAVEVDVDVGDVDVPVDDVDGNSDTPSG
jgi:hypothetical protein